MSPWHLPQASEAEIGTLAELLALKVRPGDVIALHGNLGAGKTTFARALIRALLDAPLAEVPSPTFSLVQTYAAPRLAVAHLDLYRVNEPGEVAELGIDGELRNGLVIVEWPERAPSLLGPDRLELYFDFAGAEDARAIKLAGFGNWVARVERLEQMRAFLAARAPWNAARIRYLQGDASARAYARLDTGSKRALLMDAPRQPDGPPVRAGLPYSRIAHLAEDVRPFVAIARRLGEAGFSVPQVMAADLEAGLLLIEDLGDGVFGRIANEDRARQPELWRAATDALVALRKLPVPSAMPLPDGSAYNLPLQDRGVLMIEAELLADWYWPYLKKGETIPDAERQEFIALWNAIFDRVLAQPTGWVLRDYHSPNLIWLPDRAGERRVGIIDFQDALLGPAAYDLVSVLQDARVDVPHHLETVMFEHYCARVSSEEPRFDRAEFAFSYAALGAQRATKILGIFARLAKRDGKPDYLRHMPRVSTYLARSLAHPELGGLARWFERNLGPVHSGPARTPT